jgi:D-sedoheptulose 7-phosphate isomerase
MGKQIAEYFEKLAALFSSVEVTDRHQGRMELSKGLLAATELIVTQTAMGRKVMFIGNGGSAAIASHQAVDYWKNGGMRAVSFKDS